MENTLPGQLNESQQNSLVEKWQPVLDATADGEAPISDRKMKKSVAIQLENTEKWMLDQGYLTQDAEGNLTENQNVAANLGTFTPIIVPTTRRLVPGLLANQLVGVQPMATPTGYAFAWRAHYAGDATGTAHSSSAAASVATTVSPIEQSGNSTTGPQFGSVIVTFASAAIAASDLAVGDDVRDTTGGGGNVHGTVKYFETSDGVDKVLIDYVLSGSNPAFPITAGTNVFFQTDNDQAYSPLSVIGNEINYNVILHQYAGNNTTTATGEALGTDMKEVSASMERVTVTATTRKLKARYTLEMAQDLKSVHGMDAEAELMSLLQTEVTGEIDRDLLAAINDNATAGTNWVYGQIGAPANTATHADGQWEQEKLRTLYTRIIKESNLIAKTTRRGPGNFIVGSIGAISALEGLSNFMYAQVPGSVSGTPATITRVGTLDGRFSVYVDTLHGGSLDYITVGYKGAGNMEAGIVYCPYIPLMMMKTTDQDTFQPSIGAMTRSAIAYNINGTQNYYRKFNVTLTGSSLA